MADKFALQSVGELHLRLTVLLKGGFYEKPRRFSTDVIKGRLRLKYFLSCGNSSILSNRMLLNYAGHVLKRGSFSLAARIVRKVLKKLDKSFMKGEIFSTRRILLLPCSLTEDFAFLCLTIHLNKI